MNSTPQSWYDLSIIPPIDPRLLIADARIGSSQATFTRSTDFLQTTWANHAVAFSGNTLCEAWETDNLWKVEDAAQWTMVHQTGNFTSAIAPPLRKVVFLRGGRQWKNTLEVDLGATTFTDIQMTFRDNAASAGNFANSANGSIPVFLWTGNFTGKVNLVLSLQDFGRYSLVLKLKETALLQSMFEMEFIIVP